jgi:predicted Zn-dependent protease
MTLSVADQARLTAAEGYAELGMWQDAWDELEEIAPDQRHGPSIMTVRVTILLAMKRWESAAMIAESLITRGSMDGQLYLDAAYAVRRSRSLPEAHALLLRGEPLLSKQAVFHFNLACYECQLGNLEEAKRRLARAFALDAGYRLRALDDEDLQPLWAVL